MNRLSSRRIVKVALSVAACLVSMLVAAGAALAETVTFQSTGAEQTFRVPAGVTSLHVVATGGKGGNAATSPKAPGFGTTATGDLLVSPQQLLYIEVGGNGASSTGFAGGAGGFNGGGNGGNTGDTTNNFKNGGGGGGGASDIRLVPRSAGNSSLESRLITAGGGGGVGGGAEGGFGGSGSSIGLGEGGQSGGGAGGGTGGQGASTSAPGPGGALGTGGAGGSSAALTTGGGGGGAGAGLYGGGGGVNGSGGGASGGGGSAGSSGFGSSVKNSSLAKDTTGVPTVVITYTAPSNNGGGTGTGTGGSKGTGNNGTGGNNGAGGNPALDTTIDAKPAKLIETRRESRKVKFRFSANKGGASFLCKLDFTAFAPCASPKGYRLGLGPHTFKVKAVGDTTPAVYSFRIKRKF